MKYERQPVADRESRTELVRNRIRGQIIGTKSRGGTVNAWTEGPRPINARQGGCRRKALSAMASRDETFARSSKGMPSRAARKCAP
jgi:hypothetical protein